MPIFIIFSFVLSILIQNHYVYLPLLNLEAVWIASASLAGLFLFVGWMKWLSASVWLDAFACSTLITWYGYWKPFFSAESPQFYVFPIYFGLLSAWMLFGFINKSQYFDWESQEALRYLQKYLARFDVCIIATLLLITLALPEHYLSYPIAMTLFIVRSAFHRCLEIIERL